MADAELETATPWKRARALLTVAAVALAGLGVVAVPSSRDGTPRTKLANRGAGQSATFGDGEPSTGEPTTTMLPATTTVVTPTTTQVVPTSNPGGPMPTTPDTDPDPVDTTPVTPDALITQYRLNGANREGGDIAAGPDGDVWFSQTAAFALPGAAMPVPPIGRITATGQLVDYMLPAPLTAAGAVTRGPDGAIWFNALDQDGNNFIARITAAGTVKAFPLNSGNLNWQGLVTGPDGALWFAGGDYGTGGFVGKMTTAGVVTVYNIGCYPQGIAAGPDGNVWVTDACVDGGANMHRVTPDGVATSYPLGRSTQGFPTEITAGPDNALWFAWESQDSMVSSAIGRVTMTGKFSWFDYPPTSGAPTAITAGPDGNIWFTSGNSNQIVRLTPTGKQTAYAAWDPKAITAGPDGNIWFTQTPKDHAVNRLNVAQADAT